MTQRMKSPLLDATGSVGPDYVYGDDAVRALREELEVTEVRVQSKRRSGVVKDYHVCQTPSTSKHGAGSVYYCEDCGRFSELEQYSKSRGRVFSGYSYRWKHVGWFRQKQYEARYL